MIFPLSLHFSCVCCIDYMHSPSKWHINMAPTVTFVGGAKAAIKQQHSATRINMAEFDDEDPLTQIEGIEGHTSAPSECGADGVESSNRLQLTFAGIRTILNRKVRPKPLLRIQCKGCGRTTHSPDTYIDIDYLEIYLAVR